MHLIKRSLLFCLNQGRGFRCLVTDIFLKTQFISPKVTQTVDTTIIAAISTKFEDYYICNNQTEHDKEEGIRKLNSSVDYTETTLRIRDSEVKYIALSFEDRRERFGYAAKQKREIFKKNVLKETNDRKKLLKIFE